MAEVSIRIPETLELDLAKLGYYRYGDNSVFPAKTLKGFLESGAEVPELPERYQGPNSEKISFRVPDKIKKDLKTRKLGGSKLKAIIGAELVKNELQFITPEALKIQKEKMLAESTKIIDDFFAASGHAFPQSPSQKYFICPACGWAGYAETEGE